MLRSCAAIRNQEGSSFHRGRSPEGSWSASSVTGRCVAAMRAASGAGTSAANCSWKASRSMYRSVVPLLRGTGRSASPSVLPGKRCASRKALSPGSGANAAT